MAGLADSTVVDLVTENPSGGATLFMVEQRPWGSEPDQSSDLLAKVNTYYHYVVGGQLVEEYPGLAGKPVEVRLSCATEPTEEVVKVIEAAAQGLESHGIEFSFAVEPALHSGE